MYFFLSYGLIDIGLLRKEVLMDLRALILFELLTGSGHHNPV
jgi:hypothetical protein